MLHVPFGIHLRVEDHARLEDVDDTKAGVIDARGDGLRKRFDIHGELAGDESGVIGEGEGNGV